MALLKPKVIDGFGGIERPLASGDVLAWGEIVPAAVSTQPLPLLAAMIVAGIVLRSNGAGSVDTIDTAAAIISALSQGVGTAGVEAGSTFRLRYIASLAFSCTLTATANTGITVTSGVVNASSVKEFLVTIVNGTPAKTCPTLATVSGSADVTGFTDAEIAALSPGMIVLNAVANLQGQTIIGINMAKKTVTMSGNANATAAANLQFSPRVSFYGLGQGLL